MDLKLGGKKVLITGGSRGLGRAIGGTMAEEGCEVILASRTEADLQKAQVEITESSGAEVSVHAFDLSKTENLERLVNVCADVDILVNNAGAIPGGSLFDVEEPRWREAWDLKVFGYINLTRMMYKNMKSRGSGVIGNIIGSDIRVGGNVVGNLLADGQVVLGSNCILKGDIVYRKLLIEDGAQFEGKCDLASENEE